MQAFGAYTVYILAAYGFSCLGVGIIIFMSLRKHHQLRQEYQDLRHRNSSAHDTL